MGSASSEGIESRLSDGSKQPGKVIALEVEVGQTVAANEVLLILEAMKMEHRIVAVGDGRIAEIRVSPGDQVATGEMLVVVDSGERTS